jgi:hypothetical protein
MPIAQSGNIPLQRPVKREYHLGNAVPEPRDTPTALKPGTPFLHAFLHGNRK